MDFEVVRGEYLIIKALDTGLFYVSLFNEKSPAFMKVQKVNLKLDKGKITEIVQTEKDAVVQIVFKEEDKPINRTYIITWDLSTNMELSHLSLPTNSLPQ